MQIEVVPTIIAQDFVEVKKKVRKIEPYVDWVQLDVMDGKFVENKTWNNPVDLKNLKTKLNLEAHLMIDKPEEHMDEWIGSGVKRIVFHIESTDEPREIIAAVKKAGLKAGVAVNPGTPIRVVDEFIGEMDLVLVMTVHPGRGGQLLLENTLLKVQRLRNKYDDLNIAVDGGINLETAPKAIAAGANMLAAGSAVWKSDNIEKTIEQLKKYDH